MDDLFELLIYALIILIGGIASAVQAKKKAQTGNKSIPRKPSSGADTMPPFFDVLTDRKVEEIFGIPEQNARKSYYEPETDSVEAGPSVEEGYGEQYFGRSVEEGPSVEEGGFEAEKRPVYVSIEDHIKEMQGGEQSGATSSGSNLYGEGVAAFNYDDLDTGKDLITAGEIVSEEAAAEAERVLQEERVRIDWRQAIIYSEILKRKEF